jgi:hypothetical protein
MPPAPEKPPPTPATSRKAAQVNSQVRKPLEKQNQKNEAPTGRQKFDGKKFPGMSIETPAVRLEDERPTEPERISTFPTGDNTSCRTPQAPCGYIGY